MRVIPLILDVHKVEEKRRGGHWKENQKVFTTFSTRCEPKFMPSRNYNSIAINFIIVIFHPILFLPVQS